MIERLEREEIKKNVIRSSKGELEQFMQSMVWKDILDELTVMIERSQKELSDLPTQARLGLLPAGSLEVRLGGVDASIKAFTWMADNMLLEMIQDLDEDPNAVAPADAVPVNEIPQGPKPFTGTLM